MLRRAVRAGLVHIAAGLGAALLIAVALANTTTGATPRLLGPFYDPDRLGIWLEERTPGRRSVIFMLARSRIYEDAPGAPRLVSPRPERASPAWTTDWSRAIPAMQASGTMIDPTQTQEHAFGWPAVCLASADYLEEQAGGTFIARSEHAHRINGVVVPGRVWAPGLVINTLVLGAPAGAAYLVGTLIISMARRHRGVCPLCCYPTDPEITVCPECGHDAAHEQSRLAA